MCARGVSDMGGRHGVADARPVRVPSRPYPAGTLPVGTGRHGGWWRMRPSVGYPHGEPVGGSRDGPGAREEAYAGTAAPDSGPRDRCMQARSPMYTGLEPSCGMGGLRAPVSCGAAPRQTRRQFARRIEPPRRRTEISSHRAGGTVTPNQSARTGALPRLSDQRSMTPAGIPTDDESSADGRRRGARSCWSHGRYGVLRRRDVGRACPACVAGRRPSGGGRDARSCPSALLRRLPGPLGRADAVGGDTDGVEACCQAPRLTKRGDPLTARRWRSEGAGTGRAAAFFQE